MKAQQPHLTPPERVRRVAPGLVAHSAGDGVAFGSATFNEFMAAHVAQLPEHERGPALAWLSGFGGLLGAAGRAR